MTSYVHIPYVDYSNELSTAKLPVADAISDVNITALFGAVEAITIGNSQQVELRVAIDKDVGVGGIPTAEQAQREMKFLCRYHDATTLKKYTLEIPTPDFTDLAANSDFLDVTAGDGLAFKTQFELFVIASLTGNATILDSAELVGRKL